MAPKDVTRDLEIRSGFDGTLQRAALRLPRHDSNEALPLIYAPHPFGWSVDEDYHGGCNGLKAGSHDGWLDVATDLAIAVLQPAGHHRVVSGCSLGYPGAIRDVPDWVDAADGQVRIDRDRVYACGLSMGGQEALLAVGHHPGLFCAAFVFNPVVDVAAWLDDLERTEIPDLRAEGADAAIIEEVGGRPSDVPRLYEARSPLALLPALRRVPLTIWWSGLDAVVPRQIDCHGKRLYDALKERHPTAPVSEYEHSSRYDISPTPTDDERWAIHETADYRFAAQWLLLHRREKRGHRPGR